MKEKGVARRYAKAILDTAKSDKEMETFTQEIAVFADAYIANGDLRKVLMNPAIDDATKRSIVGSVAKSGKFSAGATRSLEVLLENGRIDLVGVVSESCQEISNERLGVVNVQVESAHEVSKSESGELEKIFSDITGKKAKVTVELNQSLIGGIVARVGSKVYDGSVSNQLRLMKVKLGQEV